MMKERKEMQTTNYTTEQTKQLVALYAERGNEGLEDIAREMGKTLKSVRAKLVREGAYVAPDKVKKLADGPSKKELVRELSQLVGKPLAGIDAATKESLSELIEAFRTR